MPHSITKTYGHNLGISACFRQWRAESHCRFLHGYPLSFSFTFRAQKLDDKGWVFDFGALKPLKERLIDQFDHKTLIARNDPELPVFVGMHERGLIDLRIMDEGVGCEAFAKYAHAMATSVLITGKAWPRVDCTSVTVSEHDGNRATYDQGEE